MFRGDLERGESALIGNLMVIAAKIFHEHETEARTDDQGEAYTSIHCHEIVDSHASQANIIPSKWQG